MWWPADRNLLEQSDSIVSARAEYPVEQTGNSELHRMRRPLGYSPARWQPESVQLMSCHFLSLPDFLSFASSFFPPLFVINLSLSLPHCLCPSFLSLSLSLSLSVSLSVSLSLSLSPLPWTHRDTIRSMSPSCMVPAINATTPFLCISVEVWRLEQGLINGTVPSCYW